MTREPYFDAAGRTTLLSREEIDDLYEQMRVGRQAAEALREGGGGGADRVAEVEAGRRAREVMITSNLRLVMWALGRYRSSDNTALMDMAQAGNVGLITAVDGFDPTKGFAFSTYATWWILQAIDRWIDQNATVVSVSSNTVSAVRRSRRAGVEEEAWGAAERRALAAMHVIRLDGAVGEHGDGVLGDLVADPRSSVLEDEVARQVDHEASLARIDRLLGALSPRDRLVVRARLGLDGRSRRERTLRALAAEVGLTVEGVRQVEVRALARLRRILEEADGGLEGLPPVGVIDAAVAASRRGAGRA